MPKKKKPKKGQMGGFVVLALGVALAAVVFLGDSIADDRLSYDIAHATGFPNRSGQMAHRLIVI